jgi:chemotaxis receptor (MCP) glutamine deamidase CheD
MSLFNVGIGEWHVASDPEDIIKTYALGSCVAVIIHDVKIGIVGMIHIALPESSIDPEKAAQRPGYFADTGLPLMIEEMKLLGSTRSNVRVKLGRRVRDGRQRNLRIGNGTFRGEKNSLEVLARRDRETPARDKPTVAVPFRTANDQSPKQTWTI